MFIEYWPYMILSYLSFNVLFLMILTVEMYYFKKMRFSYFEEEDKYKNIFERLFIVFFSVMAFAMFFPTFIILNAVIESVRKYQAETGKRI